MDATPPDSAARVKRVSLLLRQYPGVAEQADAVIQQQAWSIVHYGTGARLAGSFAESRKQLTALAALVRPLREFLEADANLNRHALYALEESGFLEFDSRNLHAIVGLLRKAEIGQPKSRGRPKEDAKRVIAQLAASAIMHLTGRRASYTTRDSGTSGPFVDLMKALYAEFGIHGASTDTATTSVSVIAEAYRMRHMSSAEYEEWYAEREERCRERGAEPPLKLRDGGPSKGD